MVPIGKPLPDVVADNDPLHDEITPSFKYKLYRDLNKGKLTKSQVKDILMTGTKSGFLSDAVGFTVLEIIDEEYDEDD